MTNAIMTAPRMLPTTVRLIGLPPSRPNLMAERYPFRGRVVEVEVAFSFVGKFPEKGAPLDARRRMVRAGGAV